MLQIIIRQNGVGGSAAQRIPPLRIKQMNTRQPRYMPGVATPGAVPVVEAAPALPGFVAAPAPAAPSSSGDFLAMACAQRVAKFEVGPLHPPGLRLVNSVEVFSAMESFLSIPASALRITTCIQRERS